MRTLSVTATEPAAKSGDYRPQPKKSHWIDPIATRVAVRLGCSPLYAEKRMREAEVIARLTVEEMRGAGADKRAERYVEGIQRANEQRTPPPDCDATWDLADRADGKEDVAESAYHRNPTLKTRAAYIDALREDRRYITSIIDLLIDEQERAQQDAERQS